MGVVKHIKVQTTPDQSQFTSTKDETESEPPAASSSSSANRPTKDQQELFSAALPTAADLVREGQSKFGYELHEMLIAILDVRGSIGKTVAHWTIGEEQTSFLLLNEDVGDLSAIAIPCTLSKGIDVTAALAPQFCEYVAQCPRGRVPMLVIDKNNVPALVFVHSTLIDDAMKQGSPTK